MCLLEINPIVFTQCEFSLSASGVKHASGVTMYCIRKKDHSGNHVVAGREPDLDNEFEIWSDKGKWIRNVIIK